MIRSKEKLKPHDAVNVQYVDKLQGSTQGVQ